MNGRTAKAIRRQAAVDAYEHYLTLLDEEQQKELTITLAVEYTPTVAHVDVETKSHKKPWTKQTQVSENTMRWFIKNRKKLYVVT